MCVAYTSSLVFSVRPPVQDTTFLLDGTAVDWTTRESRFDFRKGKQFLFFKASKQALKYTQAPPLLKFNWYLGLTSRQGKAT
jgi:hypothetical protein